MSEGKPVGELTLAVHADVAEALKGIKALNRELRETVKLLDRVAENSNQVAVKDDIGGLYKAKEKWLSLDCWDSTIGKWNASELAGKSCYAGIADISAICLLFPPQQAIPDWRVIFEKWIPEDSIKEWVSRDGASYDRWVAEKHLCVIPGNFISAGTVVDRLKALSKLYDIKAVGADLWNANMFVGKLTDERIRFIDVPQSFMGVSQAMKVIKRLLTVGAMTHENTPVVRWCLGNTEIVSDANGNIKPIKSNLTSDTTVALINAMAAAIKSTSMGAVN